MAVAKMLRYWAWLAALNFVASLGAAQNPLAIVMVRDAPKHGVVMAKVDLSQILQLSKIVEFNPTNLRASLPKGRFVPIQFVPEDERHPVKGTLLMQLPSGGDWQIRLTYELSKPSAQKQWDGTIKTSHYTVKHDITRMGGFPSEIQFPKTGKVFATFVWNDRVHHRDLGSFHLRNDKEPQVQVVSDGEIATVVRVKAKYCQSDGKQPASQPEAVYDWFYFRNLPLIFVTAKVRQREPFAWNELHFLELNFPDESFREWAGGEPLRQGKFEASQKSFGFPDWGALIDGRNVIAVLRSGQALFHDGRGGYGTYLHAHGDSAWVEWRDREQQFSGWLLVGSFDEPIPFVRSMLYQLPTDAKAIVTLSEVRNAIVKAKGWHRALAEKLEAQGRFNEALQFAKGKIPNNWLIATAGDLGIAFERTADGIRLQSLFDLASVRSKPRSDSGVASVKDGTSLRSVLNYERGGELLAEQTLPLFTITLRHLPAKREIQLHADSGWQKVEWRKIGDSISLRWQRPKEIGADVIVDLRAVFVVDEIAWSLSVTNLPKDWSIMQVSFPQLAVADLGENAEVFLPRGPGEVHRNLWRKGFSYRSFYPNGWATMQFVAAYSGTEDAGRGTGIYVGVHDPNGSGKNIVVRSEPNMRRVILAFEQPVPNMTVGGNEFHQSGKVVWRILRGDWFDAAMIYRNWVRKEAKWFPKLGKDGRMDTPQWMKELCVWAWVWMGGSGAPKDCVPIVKEFAKFMGVPVGMHWYNWHQIPFDNDYPHYFPTKEGFAESVRELQQSGVFVMPYINGRLWDTRDKGTEDWQFSKVALPAATKREDGTPYTESYGSKEADGSDVKLAPMCPATKLWQDKVREIVLRLFNEFGVNAVYIDQVAAAPPVLCFDKTHGHPLGGGSWWNEGYWQMLDAIRKVMPKDRMLTTECNAEPFVKWFDGYLTWHWQHDGQVPAFPAVYGGAVQMFGRAYRGGATKDLALRMKAGQQLVFGEQIGWIDPSIVREKENAEFLRQVVRLRWHLRRYFYAGEMARPPKLIGNIPKVRADWQWAGEWWVETDAILTGAWKLPQEGKLVLLFVNVSDQPLTATLIFDGKSYGLTGKQLQVVEVTEHGSGASERLSLAFRKTIHFPAKTAFALEIKAVK